MGSMVEINDTLQLTKKQGFPPELDLERHLKNPILLPEIDAKLFSFSDKPKIRNYQQAPTRVFLAENRDGKWIYWGKVHVLEVKHDYVAQTTSGTYKIIDLFSPEEMKQAFRFLDGRAEFDYFA